VAAAVNDSSDAVVRDSASEAVHARLALAAVERERAGDTAGAIAAQMHAALHAAADSNAERERSALASLQRLYQVRGEAEAAILFGKRSVNLIQSLRRSLEQLDR